jgi:ribosomal protein L37AE/L43A
MSRKKIIMCMTCKAATDHFHQSGWWICENCKNSCAKTCFNNTNRNRGEDRSYEASGESHNKIAKGSHGRTMRR